MDRWDWDDLARRRMSRRGMLGAMGKGGLGLSAAAILAACGGKTSAAGPASVPSTDLPPLAHKVSIAQWPLYIDKSHGTHPTLEAFQKATGIVPDYQEVIDDNQAFFAQLAPQFQAGQSTGWDLITLSDWVVVRLDTAGWIEALDWNLLPTVDQNLLPAFRDPVYDRGNAHSVPWQGGVTGVAYHPDKVGGSLTSFDDLWREDLAGHVGMLTEMVDTMSLTLLSLGVEPTEATIDDAKKAQEKLIQQRDAGIVRKYYGQDYVDDLVRGDTWASMAWSGDIFYNKYLGGAPDLEFIVPSEGGMLWTTPSEIPIEAAHPRDAHAYMDFFYKPEIAAQVTDWVLYMTPVKGVQEIMQAKADDTSMSAGDRKYYDTLSQSPLLFPPEDISQANLHLYKALSESEYQTYAQLFSVVVNGA
jgi:spermidine/putrescine transport system substrate-binding protein